MRERESVCVCLSCHCAQREREREDHEREEIERESIARQITLKASCSFLLFALRSSDWSKGPNGRFAGMTLDDVAPLLMPITPRPRMDWAQVKKEGSREAEEGEEDRGRQEKERDTFIRQRERNDC